MEKSYSNFTYRMIQSIMNLLRFVEMFVFFLAISKFSSQLPSIVHVLIDYFRGISFNCVFSPKLVFVIGNVIVLIRRLRRSVTELSRSTVGGGGDGGNGGSGGGGGAVAVAVAVDGGDKLSCNEFRRRVEEFIARQQKMLRDEEFSPMVYEAREPARARYVKLGLGSG